MIIAAAVTVKTRSEAAELLVLSSELPGLNEGALIASDEPIHLPQGSGLTLMAEDAAVIKLVGPYDGVPAPAQQREGDRSLLTAIAGLMTGPQEKSSTATGVIRSPGADDQPASPWLIDTSHAGHVCVRAGEPATLWRRDENEATTLTIAPNSGGPSAALEWAQGAAHIDWPRSVPLEDGARYRLKFKGVLIARELSVHIVPSQFSTEAHQIAWMATQGCTYQARLLLRRLR